MPIGERRTSGIAMTGTLPEEQRCLGALHGLFIGDALAMPVHWYYDREALTRDYGTVRDYLAPRNPHPDSILWRSRYDPVNEKADILHDQAQYWGQRGVHYHQFLKAGENTLNIQLVTLLTTSLLENGDYDAEDYLRRYIAYMTTPGTHRDTYVEEVHRAFFNRYARGTPPTRCGIPEKHIGGLVAIPPIVLFYRHEPEIARRASLEHLSLTHLGENMRAAANLLVDLLLDTVRGKGLLETLESLAARGEYPFLGFPFSGWLKEPDRNVIGSRFSTACYVEDSVPSVLYLAFKYSKDPEQGLIANTQLGGDNAHRGAILGALLGAENGLHGFPERWVAGLVEPPSAALCS